MLVTSKVILFVASKTVLEVISICCKKTFRINFNFQCVAKIKLLEVISICGKDKLLFVLYHNEIQFGYMRKKPKKYSSTKKGFDQSG